MPGSLVARLVRAESETTELGSLLIHENCFVLLPFFYQIIKACSLKRKDPSALAADPPLQLLLENSHGVKVLWFVEKSEDCQEPK